MTARGGRSGGAYLVASVLGVGRLRPAPGTLGAAVGMAIFVPLLAPQPLFVQVLASAAVTVIGVITADRTARGMELEDPTDVVIDELAGVWVAAIGTTDARGWILAFILFRAFDIWKPFPIRRFEAIPGGAGIMADDIAAGALALACTHLVLAWWT